MGRRRSGARPPYRTIGLVALLALTLILSALYWQFRGNFTPKTKLKMVAPRAGLVMDPGAKVTYNGVQVGRVATISEITRDGIPAAQLVLDIFPRYIPQIPVNVAAEIKATTVFGNKYVSLSSPKTPALQHITPSNVIDATKVTTEFNTLFQTLTAIAEKVDPVKLNLTLSAAGQALRGLGDKFGTSLTNGNAILDDLNPQLPAARIDIARLAALGDVYADAAPDLLDALNQAATTARTVDQQRNELDAALLAAAGFGATATPLFERAGPYLARGATDLIPTAELLDEYSPELVCTLRNYDEVAPRIRNALGFNGYALGATSSGAISGGAQSVHLAGEPAQDQLSGRTRWKTRLLAEDHPRLVARSVSGDGRGCQPRPVQPFRAGFTVDCRLRLGPCHRRQHHQPVSTSTLRPREAGMTSPLRALAALTTAMLVLTACHDTGSKGAEHGGGCRTLAVDPGWYGDNRDRINAMISQLGTCGKAGSVNAGAPLALFDWDNTMIRNDVGHATFFWVVRNSKVRQPAGGDWTTTSPFLTPPAAAALAAACGNLAAPGQPLPTGQPTGQPTGGGSGTRCADELVAIYSNGETRSGETAFAGYNHRRFKPVDAWLLQLLAGWTDADVTGFATAARQESLDAPQNAEQPVGSTRQPAWVRYYQQMRDLVGALQANGFDVRVVSASPELVVRVWAADVGIPADRVMGVLTDHDGDALTPRLALCGGEPSMPFNEGKRCRINQQVFGIAGAAAFEPSPEPRRQVFAAGDSDGDATFLMDATALRLVLNRNQIELMCRAYSNPDGRWLINPTFINPLPQSPPYPCATQGFDEPDGGQAALRRTDGSVVPDQPDRVH